MDKYQDALIDVGASKTYKFYKGEITLIFRTSGHRYEVNGLEVAGVTTILRTIIAKEALVNWAVKTTKEAFLASITDKSTYTTVELGKLIEEASKAHRRVLKTAGDVGVLTHSWIESHIKAKIAGSGLPPKPSGNSAIDAFMDWESAHRVEYLESEKPVYSRTHNYCGTLDFIATVDGKKTLGDIKTSNYIYPEQYFLQVAGYKYAYEEERVYSDKEGTIEDMLIIKVPKTSEGKLEVVKVPDYADNAKAFIRGVYLYEQVTKLKNYYK